MASCKYKYINYSRKNNAKKNKKTRKGAGKRKYEKIKQLRWAPEETLKDIKTIYEDDPTRGRAADYAEELERNTLGSSLLSIDSPRKRIWPREYEKVSLVTDPLLSRAEIAEELGFPEDDPIVERLEKLDKELKEIKVNKTPAVQKLKKQIKSEYLKNWLETEDIRKELSADQRPALNRNSIPPDSRGFKQHNRVIKRIPEFVGRAKPERIGGGNLIGRMERLSVENSKKPKNKQKKQLRWADGAHDPSWGHQWLPSEEDSSNIENVKEIDARSECFDETRGKSYEHSEALEKEKPGSAQGWPPPRWRKERAWFNSCLSAYEKNPYKNDASKKYEEYVKNRKEADEIIKELASKKSGGAVESPMHTPPRVRTSMSSIIVKSNEYGLDVMLGEDLETPDQDTSIDSYVESNCIKEINKLLSDKNKSKPQKIMAINRLDKDICPRQLKMNGLQAAHLGKFELPSNKDYLPKQSSEKKVFDFVNETLSEGQIPVIIKLLNEKTYFFTQENIFKQLNNGLVFPCYQANNLATTHEPPPDLPYGVKPGQQNWDDSEKLFSFQTLLNRRVLVSFDDFKELVLNPKTIPITIVGTESERKIPAIMKYQWVVVKHPITGDTIRAGWEFVGGVGMLHCNKIRWANEKETFWNIENAEISFTKEEEEKLKEYPNFRKVPPPLTPPPPLSPPPPSSNGSFYTQNTVYTMSTDYSPPPPSLNDDSDPSPLYSDDSVTRRTNRDRPAPLRLSFSSAVDDERDPAQYEENVGDILENAARLRREMYEQNVSDGDGDVFGSVPPPPSIPRMLPSNQSDSEVSVTPARRPRPPDEPVRSSRPRVGYRLRRSDAVVNDENSIFDNELRERASTPPRSSVRSDPTTQNSSGRSSYQSNLSPELWERL